MMSTRCHKKDNLSMRENRGDDSDVWQVAPSCLGMIGNKDISILKTFFTTWTRWTVVGNLHPSLVEKEDSVVQPET